MCILNWFITDDTNSFRTLFLINLHLMLFNLHHFFRNMAQFRNYSWDPLLIISQMLAMQCTFYFGLGTVMYLLAFLHVEDISLDRIFISKKGDMLDLVTLFAYVTNCFITAVGLWYIVQRSKQCLDFTVTIHFWHFVLTCLYTGFPTLLSWWLLTLVSCIVSTFLGEYLCRYTELEEIPLVGVRTTNTISDNP